MIIAWIRWKLFVGRMNHFADLLIASGVNGNIGEIVYWYFDCKAVY